MKTDYNCKSHIYVAGLRKECFATEGRQQKMREHNELQWW